ncbi:MAG: prenyltransferase [Anaerolineales bacterium]|jgi:1,4-dihydroxy-2-naphthoate octaprenyltransferase
MSTNIDHIKHPLPLIKRWAMAINGCNVPEIEIADSITKWLVISRACVFSMTFTSGLIGVLLAALYSKVNWWFAFLCVIGIIIAHASNNLINDLIDVRRGVDTEDYPRAQYSTHPILGGLTTEKGLLRAAILLILLDGIIMIYFAIVRGPLVVSFALIGLVLSLTYTGILKRWGLGELTSFIVWGPLMIGGTAFVISGNLTPEILLNTLPYGLIVASVLVGKHIDKIEADKTVGVRSIPVVIGKKRALNLNKFFFIFFYVLIFCLVLLQYSGWGILITLLAFRRLYMAWEVYSKPKPDSPPKEWTIWPLWYVGWAMYFNRQAGEFFILGLIINLIMGNFL